MDNIKSEEIPLASAVKDSIDDDPFRVAAGLLAITHIVGMIIFWSFHCYLSASCFPYWIVYAVIIVMSVRMLCKRESDKSHNQQFVMVACFYAASMDVWFAWMGVDATVDEKHYSFIWKYVLPYVVSACVAIYVGVIHMPSDISSNKRKLTGFLLLVTHGIAFLFGGTTYYGANSLTPVLGVLVSLRLITTGLHDENKACGILSFLVCLLLIFSDWGVVYWSIFSHARETYMHTPHKWVLAIPNTAAALASMNAAFNLWQDRRAISEGLVSY